MGLNWCLIVTVCLLGLTSGIMQGMVMIQRNDEMSNAVDYASNDYGVRSHIWFKYYHIVRLTEMVLAISVGYILSPTGKDCLLVAGSLFLLWELFEIGYAYARWGTLTDDTEHINFFDIISINLTHKQTIALHVIRIVSGVTLIVWGLS